MPPNPPLSQATPPAPHDADTAVDVAIVGAGFAGASAALTLSRQGLSVALVDLHATPRHAFRAEKFSADQLPLLAELGLLAPFKAATVVAHRSINIRGAHVVDRPPVEDHGLMYADMVKLLHTQLPSTVRFIPAKATEVLPDAQLSQVRLADGQRVAARLVVLATGHARGLRERLGITRQLVHPVPTVNIAFTLAPRPGGFGFPSLAAYGEVTGDGVDYTSVFPVGDTMRVNVFVFGSLSEPRITAFKRDPMAALLALQPGLKKWLAGCTAADAAELFAVEISLCQGVRQPGLVLIGDAYRTSCPAIGNGLSCLLVDVARLAALAPGWLATPGMDVAKIAQFYDDPQKQQMDAETHQRALQRREAVLGSALGNRVRRSFHFTRRRVADRLSSWR